MKSQKDCQEFYAALLAQELLKDNRFDYRGSSWPYQLVLANPMPDAPLVEFRLPKTDVGTPLEEKPVLRSRSANVGEAIAAVPAKIKAEQQPKRGSSKKKKGSSSSLSSSGKRRRDEDEEEEPDFCVQPDVVVVPANEIRKKVLDGDEVIVYHSAESKIPMMLLRDLPCCTACGAFEEQFRLLGCGSCGQFYHNFCLNMKNMPEDLTSWKCPSCKRCEKCKQTGHDDRLLVCDFCDLGFHTYCLEPPLPFIPHGDWLCAAHAECKSCGTKTAGDHPNHTWHDNDTLCHLCWTRIRNKSQCPSCLKAYDNNQWDSHMVGCDCGRWVHRGCDGISIPLYQELQMPNRQDEPYWCIVCRSSENKPQFLNPELLAMVETDSQLEQLARMTPPPPPKADLSPAARPDVVPAEACAAILCAFCSQGSNSATLGRLVPVSRAVDTWVHCGCAIWSKDVVLRKTGGVAGLVEALARAKDTLCSICNQSGASLHCRLRGCPAAYHLPCALRDNRLAMHRLYFSCPDHADPTRPPPVLPLELGHGKAFVTLPPEFKAERRAAESGGGSGGAAFSEQSWEDRIKSFIAKNPSAFLNQKYEDSIAASKSSARDVAFKAMAARVNGGYAMQRGSLVVTKFGSVRFEPAFHSSRYIFPVGFEAFRHFWSYVTPNQYAL